MVKVSRRSFFLFSVVTVLYWTSLYTYVPILSPYLESLGYSFSLIGLIIGSYGFIQMTVRLPLSIWSDRLRLSKKPFLLFGLLTAGASCLLFTLSGVWGVTLAARALAGVSASTWVFYTILFASYFRQEEATRAMGIVSFLAVAGQVLGMSLSGLLSQYRGWESTFQAGAMIASLGIVLALFVYEPKARVSGEPMQFKDLAGVVKSPMLIKVSFLSILAQGIVFITMFGFTPSQALNLGASKSDLTLLSITFMVPSAVSSILAGKWASTKFGDWNTIIAGFFLSAVSTLAISYAPNFAVLAITQAVNGFAQGLYNSLMLGLAIQTIEPSKRTTAMGFYQSVYAVGMFCGPFLAGWLNETFGMAGGFALGGAIGIIAGFLAMYWQRKESRKEKALNSLQVDFKKAVK